MSDDLQDRLRRAGEAGPTPGRGPDLQAIEARGSARRRNKRLGAGLGIAAVVTAGAVGLSTGLDAPTRIEAATDQLSSEATGPVADDADAAPDDGGTGDDTPQTDQGDESDDAVSLRALFDEAGYVEEICFSYDDALGAGTLDFWIDDSDGQVIVVETRDRGSDTDPIFVYEGRADDTGTRLEAFGILSGDDGYNEQNRLFEIDPDLGGAQSESHSYPIVGCPHITVEQVEEIEDSTEAAAGQVDDGLGGSLAITDGELVHLRADGQEVPIPLPDPAAGDRQRWVTDIAPIDGVPYLFITQFVNREPVDTNVDFRESILAVNLETDQVIVVEERRITEIESVDWTYNGHVTTDGTNIIVMRELWQSFCLYAEGLTLDGQPVDVPQATDYPKPDGLDGLTADDIAAIQFGEPGAAVTPCLTLDDIPDEGVDALGRQADADQFAAFADAFFKSGLG